MEDLTHDFQACVFIILGIYIRTTHRETDHIQYRQVQYFLLKDLIEKYYLTPDDSRFIYSAVSNRFNFTDIIVNSEEECDQYKFVVYRCDYRQLCGGLADRQKGIVTSFLLAVLSGRAFVLDMNANTSCPLESLLKPHFYDWTRCKSFVNSIKENLSKSFILIDKPAPMFITNQSFDFNYEWKWQVVSVKINNDFTEYIRKHKKVKERLDCILSMTLPDIVATILHTLFQPIDESVYYLKEFYQHNVKGKSLVCSHIRTGQNPSNANDDRFEKKPDESIIFNFLMNYTEQSKYALHLATDSNLVRKKFEEKFGNSIKTNLTFVHIDRLGRPLNEKDCVGFKEVLIEQYILFMCDVLVLTKSGFGKMAAYMRGNRDQLYILDHENNRVKRVDLSDL